MSVCKFCKYPSSGYFTFHVTAPVSTGAFSFRLIRFQKAAIPTFDLLLVHPNAAGIDIGAIFHAVAQPITEYRRFCFCLFIQESGMFASVN
jgi:hypothetical protein